MYIYIVHTQIIYTNNIHKGTLSIVFVKEEYEMLTSLSS